ncbi:MAG: quinone-dependent dihydroorotate dehydrogenase [Deltaproteobacteria bacterium]
MYKALIRPVLDRLDSETWHDIAREALSAAEVSPLTLRALEWLACSGRRFEDERLRVNIGGVEFENPLLVGAGWDKKGRAVLALRRIGFAGVEVGSVLAHPQAGNPKPRQFMLAPDVALNRLGFNSPGADGVLANLIRYAGRGIPIGVSIGKNRDVEAKDAPEAHAVVARRLQGQAAYFAINVSSPNTPGLRLLQDKKPLGDIVRAVIEAMDSGGAKKPVFVKIAPELSNEAIDDVIEVALENNITGIIAVNTTESPAIKAKYGERWRGEPGGLSGADSDYRKMATEKIAYIRRRAGATLQIIGVGGVSDTKSALEKIRAGASLLQIVTGIRGEGIGVANSINRGLARFLDKERIASIQALVGADVR